MRLVNGLKLLLLAVLFGAVTVSTVRANEKTPFLEDTKLGDEQTATVRLIHIGDDVYVVVVESDTGKYYPLPAKAKKDVVKPEQCKDGVKVKAKITSYTKRPENHPAVELEILSVQ